MRLAILTSHPIQYYAPLFRELARRVDLVVYFSHQATPQQQADAGFGVKFDWDVDLYSGYEHAFLHNVAARPGIHQFGSSDTPEIGDWLDRDRVDALLLTGWNLKSYWQALWAAKRRGIPVVARGDSHLKTPRASLRRAVKRVTYPTMLRLFDAAAYVGQRNWEYWRHYGYPPERLFFSPHAVDAEFFASRATIGARAMLRRRLGVDASTTVALFAGKLVPLKRPSDTLAAAALLRQRGIDLHVLVAGAGELEHDLRDQARTDCVPVHFLGFQNQSQMPAAYAACDMLVLCSENETWGLVANEALACGRPIIVSDACGCAPDLAADGTVGRVTPVGDITALAGAMLAATLIPPSLEAIAEKVHRYSLQNAAHGIEEAFRNNLVVDRRSNV